jgi:hypothetical protein
LLDFAGKAPIFDPDPFDFPPCNTPLAALTASMIRDLIQSVKTVQNQRLVESMIIFRIKLPLMPIIQIISKKIGRSFP